MRSFVYRSTALVASESPECQAIVETSIRNNARFGLTGFLHAEPTLFVQYLEGPAASIDFLRRRLAADPRHRDMITLGEAEISARRFPDWRMGYSTTNVLSLSDFLLEATGDDADGHPTGTEALYFLIGASHRVDLGIHRRV